MAIWFVCYSSAIFLYVSWGPGALGPITQAFLNIPSYLAPKNIRFCFRNAFSIRDKESLLAAEKPGVGPELAYSCGKPTPSEYRPGQVRDWPHSGWRQGKGHRLLGAHSPCTVPHGYCRAFIILLPIFSSSVLPMTANGRCAWNRRQRLRAESLEKGTEHPSIQPLPGSGTSRPSHCGGVPSLSPLSRGIS